MLTPKLHKLISGVLIAALIAGTIQPSPLHANPTVAARDQALAQIALNAAVSQTVAGAALTVVALNSEFDQETLQATASRFAGRGTWRLDLADDQKQPLKVEGVLNFEITHHQQGQLIPDTSITLNGTLKGDDVELVLDSAQSARSDGSALDNTVTIAAQLTRHGKVNKTRIKATAETRPVAYGLTQSTYQASIDRDGQQAEVTLITSGRISAKGEGELWRQLRVSTQAGQPLDFSSDAHLFIHAGQGQAALFFDRLDFQAAGNRLSLQSPASITMTSGGQVTSDVVLVDENGQPINQPNSFSIPATPAGPVSRGGQDALLSYRPAAPVANVTNGERGPIQSINDLLPTLGLCREDRLAILYGLVYSVLAGLFGAFLFVALASPVGSLFLATFVEFISWDTVVSLFFSVYSSVLLQWLQRHDPAHATQWAVLGLLLSVFFGVLSGNVSGAVKGDVGGLGGALIGAFTGWLSGATSAITGALAGSDCNADPYFISPGIQPRPEMASAGPMQVLSVRGGLIKPALADHTPSGSPPLSVQDYDDRPEAFVGGAVPTGAKTTGEWKWDDKQSFGAAASHTQPLVAGPQKHYFIQASNPLQVRPDDNIVQYVYLDPKNPPTELYLQFYTGDGDGEHRAFWGADRVQTGGKPGTASLYPMGALPSAGGWVRLKVPADKLVLSGKSISGILYGAYDGQTWWGPTTTSSHVTDRAPDILAVVTPDTLPASEPGAQIAYQVTEQSRLSIEIADSTGSVVRMLRKEQDIRPGYHVEVWDGKNDGGAPLPDKPYTARFRIAGQTVAETAVSLSPFVANIVTPSPYSLIRGNDIPVIGEAYGPMFSHYVLEYGEGLSPASWKTITTSESPVLLPKRFPTGAHAIGNLANWDVGVNEFKPWHDEGLNGVYTLRLRVVGKDGREVRDSVPVIVGRLAHSAEGGIITSPDGKARLSIPPLATQTSFELMALIPVAQVEPGGTWTASLPADMKLAGEVYEVFPANEAFRRPALLELPYDPSAPPDKVGLMLGDGRTWRYIGGKADPARKIVSVAVTEFGGQRALIAPFSANQFGPVQPIRVASQPLSFVANAPVVASSTHPVAFYDDFASRASEVGALDQFGAQLTLVRGAEAGLPGDNAALKVTRLPGGVRLVELRSTPYDASKYPILSFDYRLPPGYTPNILIRSGGIWRQLKTGSQGRANSRYYQTLRAPDMLDDDNWHHYQIDVLALLRANQLPGTPPTSQIDEIALGQVNSGPYMQVTPIDSGGQDSYYIANVAALAPTGNVKPVFTLSPAPGKTYTGYSAVLDQQATTTPPQQDQGLSPDVSLPPNAPDGLWYVHVRGKTADGNWSATAHYPLLIDRQPPTFGQPVPAPDGADAPTVIMVPIIDDVGGVDPASIKFSLNGQSYTAGPGARYDPQGRVLVIYPYRLEPPLPPVPNGQKVTASITALSDYAGNKLTAPFTWRFTSDQPKATGNDFRALTLDGKAPALSPDASQLAFVSKRAGVEKIWIIRADDYEEKARSARPLIGGNSPARESDPAWSPDGKLLAYVSDANGRPQVWVAGADGSGARALSTPIGSVVASPTWSPDGKTIVFIQDGNLWQINADGSEQHPLTASPDSPYQSVRWQPGGQLLALAFNLYEQRIELYDMTTGEIRQLTHGGKERQPAWLNGQTVLYTAPVGQGQPDGIWETSVDGSGQAVLAGSGQPGVDDLQADTSANGNATAIVSTRSGARAVWLRNVLQISQFTAEPTSGAAAGKPIRISYTLPVESEVTLQVLNIDGTPIKVILDKARQSAGSQLTVWNGDANNKPIGPGTYMLRLTAKPAAGSDPLERLTTVKVLDPTTLGSLQIQVNQWAGQPFQRFDGQVRLYPQGTRSRPVAAVDSTSAPTFELPAGRYDVVVTLGALRREMRGITVQAGKTVSQDVDLGLGGLTVTVVSVPGQPVTGNAIVTVTPSDDVTGASARSGAGSAVDFILPPGSYDVQTDYQGVRQASYGIQVAAGQVTKREINLGSGLLRLTVQASAGMPLDRTVIVEAFRPQDHKTSVAATYGANVLELRLPAGVYDLRITTSASKSSRLNVSADIVQWTNGVQIQPGETLSLDYNLHLGEARIQVFEATGKSADEKLVSFCIVPQGQRDCTNRVLLASGINSVQALLPVGVYEVIPDYSGTSLRNLGPAGSPLEVKEGQSVSQTINLKLGRIQVQVLDASGQPIKFERLQISAFLPGKRETREAFSRAISLTPVDLVVQADVPYEVEIVLDGAKKVVLTGQTVNEGETRTLMLKETDFK